MVRSMFSLGCVCTAYRARRVRSFVTMKVVENPKGKKQKLRRACRALGEAGGRGLLLLGSGEPTSKALLVPWAWQKGWCWVQPGRGCTGELPCAPVLGDVGDKFSVEGGGIRRRCFCFGFFSPSETSLALWSCHKLLVPFSV